MSRWRILFPFVERIQSLGIIVCFIILIKPERIFQHHSKPCQTKDVLGFRVQTNRIRVNVLMLLVQEDLFVSVLIKRIISKSVFVCCCWPGDFIDQSCFIQVWEISVKRSFGYIKKTFYLIAVDPSLKKKNIEQAEFVEDFCRIVFLLRFSIIIDAIKNNYISNTRHRLQYDIYEKTNLILYPCNLIPKWAERKKKAV